MKKWILVSLVGISAVAYASNSENLQVAAPECIDCLKFTAPSVFGSANVDPAEVGQIIYDTEDNRVKAFNSGSEWSDLSNSKVNVAAGTTAVTLNKTDDQIQRFAPTSEIAVTLGNTFLSGNMLTIVNAGTARIKVQSSTGTDDIAPVYPGASLQFLANTDAPDVAGEWNVIGTIVSPWESFTPTGTFTTNTTYTGYKRRVGDTLEMRVKVAFSGAPNSTNLAITLPDGLNVDTSKADIGILFSQFGTLTYRTPSIGRGTVMNHDSNQRYVYLYVNDNITPTIPVTWDSGDTIAAEFRVPIAEWTNNTGIY